ncbi:MAG: helicase [Micromonosporaceae bacterium]|nr:helicase [Micromonosporaceae bacterium]
MLVALHADPADVAAVVGHGVYMRGLQYAQRDAVAEMSWESPEMLTGFVHGSRDQIYQTVVHFSAMGGPVLRFQGGVCSCPVGDDCKHVAALALTAMDVENGDEAGDQESQPWEQSLGSLLAVGSADPGGRSGRAAATPLAIELSLHMDSPARRRGARADTPADVRLRARLVEPGKNGWIGGSLSWSRLATLDHYGGYVAAQVRVLRELHAVHQAHSDRAPYYYPYMSDAKWLDLNGFESRQLWPMLEAAVAVGVRLVHARKRFGDVAPPSAAEVCLDVTAQEAGPLTVRPVIRLDCDEVEPTPVAFIGEQAHGLVYVDRAETDASGDPAQWRPRLARLAKTVPPSLRSMTLGCQRLEVPAAESARFRDEYYPRLRLVASVISSDESFTPPEISGPTLALRLRHGPEHRLDVGWEWAYQVGDSPTRAPLRPDPGDSGCRDLDAERALLAGLDVSLERFGLLAAGAAQANDPLLALAPHTELRGLDAMRFATEALPLLADAPGVAVEVSGEPVEYREVTDSLAIAVSTSETAGETDWFDLGVEITVDGRQVPFADVFTALAAEQSHLMLADGSYFSLEKPELRSLAKLIDEARALVDLPGGGLKISRFQAGLWDELAQLGVVSHQAEAWRRQVDGLLSIGSVESPGLPALLQAQLRPYQKQGFEWLAFLWQHQLGGILADDMGLGKTLQSLALICHAKQTDPGIPPFLVIAPSSVVSNWAAESARFAPHLSVVTVTDTLRRRGQTLDEIACGADVVVTSHTLFRLDFDDYSEGSWSGLVIDEAQFAKNHQSKIYQCARRLPAPFKLAITGTPMENNLMELWSLLSITAPGLFPSPTRFRDYYARPIEKPRPAEKQGSAELLAQLRQRIRPLVTRRAKEQVVADLPAKQEQVLDVELHPRHRKIYQTHLQRERQRILGLIDDMNANRFTILRSLTLLRQLALHPALVDGQHAGVPCAKLDALLEQLGEVADGGHRALVFSQFTGFLAHVRERLEAAGLEHCYLDGSTRNRAKTIQEFKDGSAPVFLISLKAGGFGLNLTEADYCFLLDPWWNPATEAQAVDRTHRIGQTRNVMVYRLIAADTIEQKVTALKARKAELFASVMDDGGGFDASLTADDIRGLLT